jgi:hypothetical protein
VTSSRFFSFHKRAFLLEDKAAVQYSGSAYLLSLVRLCAILTGPHDVAAPDSQDTDSVKRGWTFAVTDTPSSHLIYCVVRDFGRAQRSVDQIKGEQADDPASLAYLTWVSSAHMHDSATDGSRL